ncbi:MULTISPECIES: LysR family transcriptional regulator [unclassified Paenibacillus]|uniref:LysR family transcriptional regulator n=1 Tax=unclassified Paenibacillus TaxID=185978 RepID=UPI001AE61C3C|nr:MULTISPECIES: LysR family transcriptional regulator [unclassified Paenibacillus]MBP1155655.1 DNA-binding transcriptional LysR family regulator [Paenibacillus sp. PvP091]MBP1168959.1 DNA-binding transcriptional LysR family regulator [Paenibacillus sp. PvR098]MBP2439987.1 DNA-binding transcriptional LysR family regulator [Paenibacillus sp. PvP052]
MDFKKLQYFVEIADSGSFTKAAEKLLVAQPAISKSIQKLEVELQLTLFDRSEKAVALTPEGRALLVHARAILSRIEEARKEMEELRGLEKGEIRIGLPSMFGSYYFPQIIKEFKKKYPALTISVVEAGTLEVQKLLDRKEVDIGIIALGDHHQEHHEVIPLLREEMVVCLPVGHSLARRSSLRLEEILNEPLVLFKEGYLQRKIIMESSHTATVQPNVTFSTNQLSLIKSLVSEGFGITLFLRMVIKHDDHQLVPVSLNPPVFLHLGASWRKDTYLSKACQTFMNFLKQWL